MESRLELSGLDRFVLCLSAFLIAVGFYFFFLDLNTDKLIMDRPNIGVQIDGIGTQKNNGSLFWRPMSEEAMIYDGDKIFANKDHDINLRLLKSNISIKIPKNSLVVISEENGELVLNLDKGEVELSSTGIASNLKIRDKSGKTNSIRVGQNSIINLKKSSANTTVDIKKGSLDILDSKGAVAQKVGVDDSAKIENNQVKKVEFGGIFLEKSIPAEVASTLSLSEGIKSSTISLSSNITMSNFTNFTINNGKLDISRLAPGIYYARLDEERRLDKFEILPYGEILLTNNSYKIHKGEEIEISWTNIVGHNFILDIKTPDGKNVTKLTKINKFKFIPINHGRYEIKISPNKDVISDFNDYSKILTTNGQSYYRLSESKFGILDINLRSSVLLTELVEYIDEGEDKVTKISLTNLRGEDIKYVLKLDDKVFRERAIRGDQIIFRNLNFGNYLFEIYSVPENVKLLTKAFISKDRVNAAAILKKDIKKSGREFIIPYRWNILSEKSNKFSIEFYKGNSKQTYFTKQITGNQFDFKMKELSDISWRVSSLDSAIFPSKLMKLGPFGMIEKLPFIEKTIMKYQKKNGGCYKFALPDIDNAKIYQVEIFKEPSMMTQVFSTMTEESSVCWKSNLAGKFYYRYRYFDDWNQKSKYSQSGEIIFPISPLSEF